MPNAPRYNGGSIMATDATPSFADRLDAAIRAKGNPCLIGLDFHLKHLPGFVAEELRAAETPEGTRGVVSGWFRMVIESVAPLVPIVKPQVSLVEGLTWVGAQVLVDVVDAAHEAGLLLVADAKRSDIASSAQGYAEAFLGREGTQRFARGYNADAVTANPMMGRDTLEPFVSACDARGRGVFVLVKTSNPGSTETQDALRADGTPAYEGFAKMVADLGAARVGTSGYSSVGAVVGATFPQQAERLRDLMPHAFILAPGYGAQGATAADVARCFHPGGRGAIVNASRSITSALGKDVPTPEAYRAMVRENTLRMIDDITSALR